MKYNVELAAGYKLKEVLSLSYEHMNKLDALLTALTPNSLSKGFRLKAKIECV
jgi:hypothetical protein